MIPEEVFLETKELIGNRKLRLTPKERSRIKHTDSPAIKVIGTRSIPDDLFRYHVKRKYFIRADYSSSRKGKIHKIYEDFLCFLIHNNTFNVYTAMFIL